MNTSPVLTVLQKQVYSSSAGTLLPVGFSGPITYRRTSAPIPLQALFLCLQCRVMAGVVRGIPKGMPVPIGRSANPRTTSVTITRLAASGDGSEQTIGTLTMHLPLLRLKSALNPSAKSRAAAHRKMALAALRSNTSLKHRVQRYNHHASKARELDGGAV